MGVRQSKSKSNRPLIDSYDSGYEHSLEHFMALEQLVEQEMMEEENSEQPRARSRAG